MSDSAEDFFKEAMLQKSFKKYSFAAEFLEKAVEISPDNVKYRKELAELYALASNFKRTYEQYKIAKELAPNDKTIDEKITELFSSMKENISLDEVSGDDDDD